MGGIRVDDDVFKKFTRLHSLLIQTEHAVREITSGNCTHTQYNGKPYYLTWDGKCPNCGKEVKCSQE